MGSLVSLLGFAQYRFLLILGLHIIVIFIFSWRVHFLLAALKRIAFDSYHFFIILRCELLHQPLFVHFMLV